MLDDGLSPVDRTQRQCNRGPTQLHLVANAFSPAGKSEFAGIDGNDILVLWHRGFLSALRDSLYCNIIGSNTSCSQKIIKISESLGNYNLELCDRFLSIPEKVLLFQ